MQDPGYTAHQRGLSEHGAENYGKTCLRRLLLASWACQLSVLLGLLPSCCVKRKRCKLGRVFDLNCCSSELHKQPVVSATTQDQRSSPNDPETTVEIGRLRLTHVRLEPSNSPRRWRIDHQAERRSHVRVRSLGDRRHALQQLYSIHPLHHPSAKTMRSSSSRPPSALTSSESTGPARSRRGCGAVRPARSNCWRAAAAVAPRRLVCWRARSCTFNSLQS